MPNESSSSTISARSEGYASFVEASSIALTEPVNLAQLARRPEVTAEEVSHLLPSRLRDSCLPEEVLTVVTDFKYEGYLSAHENTAKRLERAVNRKIPGQIEYSQLPGLSNEMAERLSRVRPQTIGQAMRIPGLTPAARIVFPRPADLRRRSENGVISQAGRFAAGPAGCASASWTPNEPGPGEAPRAQPSSAS